MEWRRGRAFVHRAGEMMPGAMQVWLLVNPATALADPMTESARKAALTMGLQVQHFRIGLRGIGDTAR